jgi:hypothetical protein
MFQKKLYFYEMQTRSADEPTTTFVTCLECGSWRCYFLNIFFIYMPDGLSNNDLDFKQIYNYINDTQHDGATPIKMTHFYNLNFRNNTSTPSDNVNNGSTEISIVGTTYTMRGGILVSSPGAPVLLSDSVTSESVTLSWTAGESGGATITGYRIDMKQNDVYSTKVQNISSSSYTVTGLSSATNYTFVIYAINIAGTGTVSNEISTSTTTTSLGPPTTFTVQAGNTIATLNWIAPSNADDNTRYKIEMKTGGSYYADTTSTATTYTKTGLTNGTTYTFRIATVNGNAFSTWLEQTTTPYTIPGMVTNISTDSGNQQVIVSWNAGNNGGRNITGYKIEMETGELGGYAVLVADTTSTTYTKTGLTNGVSYKFKISAINVAGTGSSNTVTGIPATKPDPVSNITNVISDKRVILSWTNGNNGGSNITYYNFYKKTGGTGIYSNFAMVTTNQSYYTINQLENNTIYQFAIGSVNIVGESALAYSGPITLLDVPDLPADFAIEAGNTQANLSWKTPSDGGSSITHYSITKNPGELDVETRSVAPGVTLYTWTSLTNGTRYNFQIETVTGFGTSAPASGHTTPASGHTTPDVVLKWGSHWQSKAIWKNLNGVVQGYNNSSRSSNNSYYGVTTSDQNGGLWTDVTWVTYWTRSYSASLGNRKQIMDAILNYMYDETKKDDVAEGDISSYSIGRRDGWLTYNDRKCIGFFDAYGDGLDKYPLISASPQIHWVFPGGQYSDNRWHNNYSGIVRLYDEQDSTDQNPKTRNFWTAVTHTNRMSSFDLPNAKGDVIATSDYHDKHTTTNGNMHRTYVFNNTTGMMDYSQFGDVDPVFWGPMVVYGVTWVTYLSRGHSITQCLDHIYNDDDDIITGPGSYAMGRKDGYLTYDGRKCIGFRDAYGGSDTSTSISGNAQFHFYFPGGQYSDNRWMTSEVYLYRISKNPDDDDTNTNTKTTTFWNTNTVTTMPNGASEYYSITYQ